MTRSVRPGTAGDGGVAAGGFAGAAAPSGSTTGTGKGGAPPLLLTMLAAALDGRDELLSAAVAAAERGVDGSAIVCAVWAALHVEGRHLVDDRAAQLRTGLAQLDRFASRGAGRRGAGVQLVVERILSDRFDEPGGDVDVLRTLGGVAAWAHAEGRRWRRVARGSNAAGAPRPPLGLNPRRRPGEWPWPAW